MLVLGHMFEFNHVGQWRLEVSPVIILKSARFVG
jgi:hypothetical protein